MAINDHMWLNLGDFCRIGNLLIQGDVVGPLNVGSVTVTGTLSARGITEIRADQLDTVAPELNYVGRNGAWVSGMDVANPTPNRDFVVAAVRSNYSFEDGVLNGTNTVTSAAQGGFTAALIGAAISGVNIPAGATVAGVANPNTLTMSVAATGAAAGVRITITPPVITTQDVVYLHHRGSQSPTVGVGVTPPDGSARLQVAASDGENAMEGVRVRVGPTQTGNALVVHDSTPVERLWVRSDFMLQGNPGVYCRGFAGQEFPLILADSGNANQYAFRFGGPYGGANSVVFRVINSALNALEVDTGGNVYVINTLRHGGANLGFYNAAPIAKPTVAGSRVANPALASLLTALANLGLIIDNTTV